MSLYTKYRPRDWDSVIGQDRIKTILRSALTHDRVGHAYLLHGSRGTGKTTSARILAKGVNCLNLRDGNPCHECANCVAFDNESMLDVIEIDAASNTSVDNIRDLIEKARFEPNQGKYKVYIIDEVHMLSTSAFNALLKTLEEPPAHVKFILATTEVDKVPETIRSRALRFDFRKITEADIIARLEFVIAEEGIKAEKSAIAIIAKYARGGMRDALTLLEQNVIDSELSVEHVRMTLSLLEESQIDGIISALERYDTHTVMDTIAILRDMHVGARGFFEQIMYRLRDLMIENLDNSGYATYLEIYELIESAYTRVRSIPDGMLLIEMTLLKVVKRGGIVNREQRAESRSENEVKSEKKESKKTDSTLLGLGGGNLSKNSSAKNNIQEEFSSGEEKSNTDEQSEVGTSFSSPNSFGTFATKSTGTGL
jgi:DNA polymerase III subunit gamma/tau